MTKVLVGLIGGLFYFGPILTGIDRSPLFVIVVGVVYFGALYYVPWDIGSSGGTSATWGA